MTIKEIAALAEQMLGLKEPRFGDGGGRARKKTFSPR